MLPNVGIILINWNNIKDTKECLESLYKMDTTGFTHEIIIVDNGSGPVDKEELKKIREASLGSTLVLENPTNLGYVKATNLALSYILASGKDFTYTLQLDNDTVVKEDCISTLVKYLEEHKDIGVVGGKIFYYNNKERLQWVGESISLWVGEVVGLTQSFRRIFTKESLAEDKYKVARDVDFIVSWCSLARRELWEQVGLLDETFFFGWEDDDWCLRVKKKGYRLAFVPDAILWHKYTSADSLDGRLQEHGTKNRFMLMRKHASVPQLVFFYFYYFLLHFWLATAYYLLWARSFRLYRMFLKGTLEGVLNL